MFENSHQIGRCTELCSRHQGVESATYSQAEDDRKSPYRGAAVQGRGSHTSIEDDEKPKAGRRNKHQPPVFVAEESSCDTTDQVCDGRYGKAEHISISGSAMDERKKIISDVANSLDSDEDVSGRIKHAELECEVVVGSLNTMKLVPFRGSFMWLGSFTMNAED